MTTEPPPPPPPSSPPPGSPPPAGPPPGPPTGSPGGWGAPAPRDPADRKRLWTGVAIGFLVPALFFLLLVRFGNDTLFLVALFVWGGLPLAGLVMLFIARTRRVGLGILLGYGAGLVTGFTTCTVLISTQGFGG